MKRWISWLTTFTEYRIGPTATAAAKLVLRHSDWAITYKGSDERVRFENAQWVVLARARGDNDTFWSSGEVCRKQTSKAVYWSRERAPRRLLVPIQAMMEAAERDADHIALARVMGCGNYNCKICLKEAILEAGKS